MANKIVASIPVTVVSANGTTVSDPVALGSYEFFYAVGQEMSDRTDGTITSTVQTAISADGPWVTWFGSSGLASDGANFGFAGLSNAPSGLLFARISSVATSVTTGFSFEAKLVAQDRKL